MTNSKLKIIFLVCLLGLSFAVNADDRSRRDGFRGGETGQWRLGGDRGSRGYEIYHRDGRGWRRVPGSALDIGDGWVIGTDRRSDIRAGLFQRRRRRSSPPVRAGRIPEDLRGIRLHRGPDLFPDGRCSGVVEVCRSHAGGSRGSKLPECQGPVS